MSIPSPIDTAAFRRLSLQATGVMQTSTVAPVSATDFSMFPGGVAPTYGQYVALDNLNIWTIKAGDTHWFATPR